MTLNRRSLEYAQWSHYQICGLLNNKELSYYPIKFDWKNSSEKDEGFLAHEAQEVVHYAVVGEKDGEEMQGIDYGKLTPLLTA